MSVTARDILRQLEQGSASIRTAFLEFIRELIGEARLSEIEQLIRGGSIDRAAESIVAALGLRREALTKVAEAVRAVFVQGGTMETGARSSGARVRLGFDVGNPAAESWLRNHSSNLIRDILDDQRQAIRSVLTEAMAAGRGPRDVALDIIGRLDRLTGRRTGGIVGLTDNQAQFVVNARAELSSGDPTRLRHYLGRLRRDKRFDSIVMRAIREGKPLSAADIDRIVGRYADRLLDLRGETIGRTEALQALNAGRNSMYEQAIADGTLRADAVTKVWKTASDKRVRETHRAMQNQRKPISGVFVSSSGAQMKHPGDASLGAGAAEVIACRCYADYQIDWAAQELGNG